MRALLLEVLFVAAALQAHALLRTLSVCSRPVVKQRTAHPVVRPFCADPAETQPLKTSRWCVVGRPVRQGRLRRGSPLRLSRAAP